jgi:hypothetical protein
MLVCGAPEVRENHAEVCCEVALGMLWEARNVVDPLTRRGLQVCARVRTPVTYGLRYALVCTPDQLSPVWSAKRCLDSVCSATL